MIRLALVGCGAWGWRYIPAALECGEAIVTHVSGVGASCPSEADTYLAGVERIDNSKLLRAPVDAFVVATPPEARLRTCVPLLEAGRAVMTEKPFALSVVEAEVLASVAAKSGALLLVNHQHLFAPAYEMLREIVRERVLWVDARAGNFGPSRAYSALWDYGPHDVAMLLGIANELRFWKSYREHGTFWIHMRDGNTPMSATVWNDRAPKTRRIGVGFSDGFIAYDALADHQLVLDDTPMRVDPERPLQRAVRLFARAVRTGAVDWRFGAALPLEVTRMLAEAERGLKEKE